MPHSLHSTAWARGFGVRAARRLACPLLAKEEVAFAPAPATYSVVCRHFLSLGADVTSLDRGRSRPRVPASAHSSENVPRLVPARRRLGVWIGNTEAPICRVFI